MADIFDWSATAANNTTLDSINVNTGMSPGNVDNAIRSLMALVRNTFVSSWEGLFAGTTSGIPVSNGAGTISTKAAPTGDIVGTSDAQTLTNKTISGLATDLAVADGGTGASTAAGARTNLAALGLTSVTFGTNTISLMITLSDGSSLLIQGGRTTISGNTTAATTFPTAYSTAPVAIAVGVSTDTGATGQALNSAAATTTGIAVTNSHDSSLTYTWFAIGKA